MGKKSKFKELRRLAQQLPTAHVKEKQYSVINGSQVIEQGVKEFAGNPVDPNKKYKQEKIGDRQLNHNRELKKQYYKNGKKGVVMYANAVLHAAKKQQQPSV